MDQFLVRCQTVKEIGLWAADMMGMTKGDAVTYARILVDNDIQNGHSDFKHGLQVDLQSKGVYISDHRIETMIERKHEIASQCVAQRFWRSKNAESAWERRRQSRIGLSATQLSPILQEWKKRHPLVAGFTSRP